MDRYRRGNRNFLGSLADVRLPCLVVVSANGVETFEPPLGVKTLTVFADNDANFTGQAAAYAAAHRLSLRGIACKVCAPP